MWYHAPTLEVDFQRHRGSWARNSPDVVQNAASIVVILAAAVCAAVEV